MDGAALFLKRDLDPEQRIRMLIARAEPQLRDAFLSIIMQIRAETTLTQLADLIEQGRLQEALESAARAGAQFAAGVNGVIVTAGQSTAAFLGRTLDVITSYDTVNARAVRLAENNNLRLIREFTLEQTQATRAALVDGIQRGINPVDTARQVRQSIGLTARQVETVNRYRQALERGSLTALNRELRDRRFDASVRRAAETGEPLTGDQINRMTERYRERMLRFRSETIARTEALRSVHEGSEEMYNQAFDQGILNPDQVTRTWHTARDARVRDSHASLNGQTRAPGEAFVSGNGNELRFPGDPNAPASETVQCRCAVSTTIT